MESISDTNVVSALDVAMMRRLTSQGQRREQWTATEGRILLNLEPMNDDAAPKDITIGAHTQRAEGLA